MARSLALIFLSVCLPLVAQTTAPTPAPNLKDPKALLEAARATNGLEGDDLKPWHMKASYDLFDDDGKPLATGVFEEWWVAKDKWKRSYTGSHGTWTEYRSSQGVALDGQPAPWPEKLIASPIIHPLPEDFLKEKRISSPELHKETTPPVSCIDISPVNSSHLQPHSTYCFEVGTTALRTKNADFIMASYSQLGEFQGREIGVETLISVNQHAVAKIHIDSLVTDVAMEDSIFTPHPSSTFRPVPQGASGLHMTPPKLLSKEEPYFPLQLHQGVVVVSMVVDKDGKVTDPHVLESPTPAMTAPALNSLYTYKFKPAQLGGQPVPVTMNVEVNFRIR